MSILFDTNVLIWLLTDADRIGKKALLAVQAADQRLVSVVSQFEVAIKQRLGKIDLLDLLEAEMTRQSIPQIPINFGQFRQFVELKHLKHRDPFDLLIIALAIERKLTLITADRTITLLPYNLSTKIRCFRVPKFPTFFGAYLLIRARNFGKIGAGRADIGGEIIWQQG